MGNPGDGDLMFVVAAQTVHFKNVGTNSRNFFKFVIIVKRTRYFHSVKITIVW